MFQLGLAILFGPIKFLDLFFFSVFRKPRRTSRFLSWLSQSHQTCLWSQLWFTTAISLACFIRQTQDSCPLYENAIIQQLAALNIISFLLTLSSYYFSIQQMIVFAPSVVATYIFTILAEYILLIHPRQFRRIIQTCMDADEDKKVTWTKELRGSYLMDRALPELLSITGLIFALTGMWLFLWLRRGSWVRTSEEVRSLTVDRSEFETRAALFQTFEYSKPVWVVGVCVMLISMTLAGVAAWFLNDIMISRRGMNLLSDGEAGENLWGVGQIAALFAWVPLLVEMGHTCCVWVQNLLCSKASSDDTAVV